MDDQKILSIVLARIHASRPYFLTVVESMLNDLRHPPSPAPPAIVAPTATKSVDMRWMQYRDSPSLEEMGEMDWDQQEVAMPGTTLSDLLAQQGGSKRKRSMTHFHGIPLSVLPPPTMYRRKPRESAPSPDSMPSSPVQPASPGSSGGSPTPKRLHTCEGERAVRRSKRVDKLEGLLRKLDVARVAIQTRDEDHLDTDMESDSDDEDDVTILV